MTFKNIAHAIWMPVFFFLWSMPVHAVVIESHKYLETTGDKKQFLYWVLEKKNPYKLIYKGDEKTFVTFCDQKLNTLSWQAVNESENTDVLVERRDGYLYMEGIYHGKKLKRKHKVGDDLWLQSSSLSLRSFIASDSQSLDYWTIRPDNFKVYKLRAQKVAIETIDASGKKIDAQKIKISLTGILQGVWKSHYWFRPSDGLFLKFEGKSGLPGNPLAVVNYVGKVVVD